MYIECIASYFTTCVWYKLHDSNLKSYKRILLSFKQGISAPEARKKLYEQIVTYFNMDSTLKVTEITFINSTITEFFSKYVISPIYNYELFDKLVHLTLNNWIAYIYAYHSAHIVDKNTNYMLETKTYFIRLLSAEIDKLTIQLVGANLTTENNLQKLIEVNDCITSESIINKSHDMVDKSTQTINYKHKKK